jgi:hypothetical protein
LRSAWSVTDHVSQIAASVGEPFREKNKVNVRMRWRYEHREKLSESEVLPCS